ncbi:MAG: hypothetical protein OEW75_04380 [Cyclobacteriaceae bacterium]|nr:hypothetical protein [Cyclobacteriaceae bacterium]
MIRFFYNEMTDDESTEFKRVLNENPGFRNEYSDFLSNLKNLDKIMLAPPKRVIKSILDFSKHFDQSKERV